MFFLENKEWRWFFFLFYIEKENGKKEMIKREIATLEKALEKVILKTLKIVWFKYEKEKIWAH